MAQPLQSLLRIEVPVIVLVASHRMPVRAVLEMKPGAIIELPKSADDPLEILVHNRPIGIGQAVKVGENFGIRVTRVGPVDLRIRAIGGERAGSGLPAADGAGPPDDGTRRGAEALQHA